MTEVHDRELLAEFAANRAEPAFSAIVGRHVNLVYSTAMRFTQNASHAEEITQAVFVILARKAGTLKAGTVLSGWLYQTTRLAAANFMKGEMRRHRREQEAFMQATLSSTDSGNWEQMAPLLDEAMGELGEADRDAVVMRYFENKTVPQIAVALKVNEAAAQKRVVRALEKLRKRFVKRGVTLTGALISGALVANSVQAAPAELAAAVSAAATQGALVSATTASLVKATIETITWLKIKFAAVTAGLGVAAVAVGSAVWVATTKAPEPVNVDDLAIGSYLTNRGWLKEFEGVLNNLRYRPQQPLDPESDLYKGNSTWEASIQPGGFYIKTDSLGQSFTIGESPAEYWQVSWRNNSLTSAPKDPARGGSEMNGRAIIAEQYRQMLVTVLNLGIEGLDNRSIEWTAPNQFKSALVDYRGRQTNGTVLVTIEAATTNGLPLRLHGYSNQGGEKKQFLIKCSYDQPVLPPKKVVVERTVNGVKWPVITNVIEKAVFGLREDGAKGFSSTEFLQVPSRVILESNGVRFATAEGWTELIDEAAAREALERNMAEGKKAMEEARKRK